MQLILASASPARLEVLRNAGVDVVAMPAQVDEDVVLSKLTSATPAEKVRKLAEVKALDLLGSARKDTIHAQIGSFGVEEEQDAVYILGCDSMFEFEGNVYGKPHTAENAVALFNKLTGKSGVLHTGMALICAQSYTDTSQEMRSRTVSAVVNFAQMTDAEIAQYVDTGEPLEVAGGFAIDGRGGAFIESIQGDYSAIVGVSVNALREMLKEYHEDIANFWTP
ncbi:MAG: Maf family nucleotide pyrophosphatase [Candidatus Ancillula sp.]|jgi:septum formation protein|nr:Maf family nucleotide pyrophosphatase [Candidatus Ancillula sp.]